MIFGWSDGDVGSQARRSPATVSCPQQGSGVDIEECLACPWRSADDAICRPGVKGYAPNDTAELLLRAGVFQ